MGHAENQQERSARLRSDRYRSRDRTLWRCLLGEPLVVHVAWDSGEEFALERNQSHTNALAPIRYDNSLRCVPTAIDCETRPEQDDRAEKVCRVVDSQEDRGEH